MRRTLLFVMSVLLFTGVQGRAEEQLFDSSLNWELTEGVLTISGEGAMPEDKIHSDYPWAGERGSITEVIIGNAVTSIGQAAFMSLTQLSTIEIPASVTLIEVNAFAGCSGLGSITLLNTNPNGIDLKTSAFNGLTMGNITLIVPFSAVAAYKDDSSPWKDFNVTYDPTLPVVIADDGDPIDFTTATGVDLSTAESIVVTGQWTNAQILALRTALKSDGVVSTANAALGKMDLSGMTFLEATTNFASFFQRCTALEEVILPKSGVTVNVSLENTFADCSSLETLTNLQNFSKITNLSSTFGGCVKLLEIRLASAPSLLLMAEFSNTFSNLTSATKVFLYSTTGITEQSKLPLAWGMGVNVTWIFGDTEDTDDEEVELSVGFYSDASFENELEEIEITSEEDLEFYVFVFNNGSAKAEGVQWVVKAGEIVFGDNPYEEDIEADQREYSFHSVSAENLDEEDLDGQFDIVATVTWGDETISATLSVTRGTGGETPEIPNIMDFDPENEDAKAYVVNSQEGLALLADIVNGTGKYDGEPNNLEGYTITMTNNIELTGLTGTGWTPIGTKLAVSFNGIFDGNGHKISGLWINNEEGTNMGLFGYIDGAVIKNLGVEISDKGIIGRSNVGGLVGNSNGAATSDISNSYVCGTIKAANTAGLLVGLARGNMTNCYAYGSVECSGSYAGGVIGELLNGTVTNCYAACEVKAGIQFAGGLIGIAPYLEDDVQKVKNNVVVSPSVTAGTQVNRVVGIGEDANPTLEGNYAWVSNIPDETGGTFVHDGKNGANWSGDMTQAPINGWNEEGKDPAWLIDGTGQLMPTLAVMKSDQPEISTPKQDGGTDPETTTYTINLEVAAGIELNGLTAGDLSVDEGGHLHLQFLPEDRTLGAADVLFLIDGIETAFTELGENNFFSYILNPVGQDHTILIALKEYPVILPEVEGVSYNVCAGTHLVGYGEKFVFSLTLADGIDPDKVHVYANGREIAPDALRSVVLTYTIDKVITPITVVIEGAGEGTTGNGNIAMGDIQLRIMNYELQIENTNSQAVDVAVYAVTGQSVVSLRALRGSKTISLQPGIYIVKAGGQVFKVSVH